MPYYRTEAIILRKVDYSNTSIVFNVFARDTGRLALIAKGIKRGGAAFESEPDLFSVNDVVFSLREGGNMGTLAESSVIDDMRGIGRKIERFWAACYVVELLLDLVPEFQPLPELYELASSTLRAIAAADRVATAIFAFEAAFLRMLGHEPRLSECVECGAPRGRLKEIAVSALKGGFVCEKCAPGDRNAIRMRGSTAALIEALGRRRTPSGRKAEFVRAGRLGIGKEDARDLRRALDNFFTFLRERPSKTLRFMQASYK